MKPSAWFLAACTKPTSISSKNFDFQPHLGGVLVRLAPLTEAGFTGLLSCAQNQDTWADYPNPNMQNPDGLKAWFPNGVTRAKALLITDQLSGQTIGTTRFYQVPNDPRGIGIGFTFLHAHFRRQGQTNTELKALMFAHAFMHFERIWFHVLPHNLRSQAAVRKLGVHDHGEQKLKLTDTAQIYRCFSTIKT